MADEEETRVDDLIERLEEIREEHGNLKVGVNYESFAFKDLKEVEVKEGLIRDETRAWIKEDQRYL